MVLICPVCARTGTAEQPEQPLVDHNGGLGCARGHHFDRAKQGYVNLIVGSNPHPGDTPAMVQARCRVHQAGVFEPVHTWLNAQSRGGIVDIGAGPGEYLGSATHADWRIALDSSTAALRVCAKQSGVQAYGGDLMRPLPIATAAADTVWSVFAPRPMREVVRILKPGGIALMIIPRANHLGELREKLPAMLKVPTGKATRVITQASAQGLHLVTQGKIERTQVVLPETATDLVGMGPTAFHMGVDDIEAGLGPHPIPVTIAMDVFTFEHGAR
ncbi:putative RNA methyltransferase [Stomatohabitans albus]|uniref:putative RNA methyltransferase n=1 Tax=Stomatohabitans albus TaxID=3110766 RepID=UPI00300DA883